MFAAIVASVQLGRRRLGGGGQRATGIAIVLNVFAVLVFIPVVATLADQARRLVDVQRYGAEQQYVERPPAEGVYAAGEQVWNIYPYDAQGRLLHDVRLYDQNGTPLDLGLRFDSTKKQVLDATGEQVDNAFPYRYLDPGTGEVADVEAAPESSRRRCSAYRPGRRRPARRAPPRRARQMGSSDPSGVAASGRGRVTGVRAPPRAHRAIAEEVPPVGEMVSFASNGDSCEGYLESPRAAMAPASSWCRSGGAW